MRNIPLAKIAAAALVLLATTASSQASLSFAGNSYAIVDANGGGDSYFDASNQGNDGSTPNYAGHTFTISQGQTLLLGGQMQTFPGGFGTTAWMGYQLFNGATLVSENDNISLSFLQNANNNDYWQQLASTSGVNIDQSLSVGTYTLEVWFAANNGNTIFDSNGGANYSATISVIPEPVYPALLGFIGLVILGRFGRQFVQKFRPIGIAC